MQFREQGNKIQILIYNGYDKLKKRAIVKMVGSVDKHVLQIPNCLMGKLNSSEQEELKSHIKKLELFKKSRSDEYILSSIIYKLVEGKKLLNEGMTFNVKEMGKTQAEDALWTIEELKKLIKKEYS